jgi:hypothetical protein
VAEECTEGRTPWGQKATRNWQVMKLEFLILPTATTTHVILYCICKHAAAYSVPRVVQL